MSRVNSWVVKEVHLIHPTKEVHLIHPIIRLDGRKGFIDI